MPSHKSTSSHVMTFCNLVGSIMMANFADPTLTVESLVGVMEKVTSDEGRRRKVWERVLWWNDVTPHYDVYSKYMYATAQKETHALADVYVNIRPESSWQHLVQILYIKGEMAALMEAKPFLQQEDGGSILYRVCLQ